VAAVVTATDTREVAEVPTPLSSREVAAVPTVLVVAVATKLESSLSRGARDGVG